MIDLNQVNIIDNLVPLHFQNYLYKKCANNSNWKLSNLDGETSYGKTPMDEYISLENPIHKTIKENFQFNQMAYYGSENYLYPEHLDTLSLLHYLQLYLKYEYQIHPLRIKINLTTTISSSTNFHQSPHVDLPGLSSTWHTLLYYVNDSDGDTLIFNEICKPQTPPIDNFTLNCKVSPKKGRVILFPGNMFHCGSHPITSKARIVINYNFQLIPL